MSVVSPVFKESFYSIFFHIVGVFFGYLLINLFIQFNTKNDNRRRILQPFFLLSRILYDIFAVNSYSYIIELLTCAQILICCDKKIYNRLLVLIQYYTYSYLSSIIIICIRIVVLRDIQQLYNNKLYIDYNTLSSIIISYIIAYIYFNTKKIKLLNTAKPYIFLYDFISIATIITLSIAPILTEPTILNSQMLIPMFFILIALIIIFCLTTYSRIAITLEENAMNKIQIEKAAIESEYNSQIDDKLQQLHTLRHDMKNHLLIIDSLSADGKNKQIHDYIHKITDELNQTQTISSTSSTISALLNSKKLICDDNKIAFDTQLDFNNIYINDFTLITVLGNILDNAITAASKLDNGYINLAIKQADTYLAIHCKNNHHEKIKKREGRFISSKPSSGSKANPLHGLGLISVTNNVNKYGGTIDINYNDTTFIVDILIPNYR